MGDKKSQLEILISNGETMDSAPRRELMRNITDSMMVAADRYGNRHMEFFDLLYSRTVPLMETKLRRAVAMSLIKSGIDRDTVTKLLRGTTPQSSRIIRRSITQTLPDLITQIREVGVDEFDGSPATTTTTNVYEGMHRFSLPPVLVEETHWLLTQAQLKTANPTNDDQLAALLNRTTRRFAEEISTAAQQEARDTIMAASKAVREKNRREGITEDYIRELFLTQNATEMLIALASKLQVDTATMQRLLNDVTWETFCVASRAVNMPRAQFADLVQSMSKRRSDNHYTLRIISLYNTLPQAAAARVMRFWQVRASSMKEAAENTGFADETVEATPAQPRKSFAQG